MSDRELLEKAAKAAGWTGWKSKHGYWNLESPEGEKSSHCLDWIRYDPYSGEKFSEPTFADALYSEGWNPLTDDGDALRLAVKLDISVFFRPNFVHAEIATSAHEGLVLQELPTPDKNAATRRAIVRAAAQIGEQNGN